MPNGPAKNLNLAKCDVSKQLRQFHSKLFERLSLITEDQLNKRNEKKYNNMVDNISQIITKEDFQLVIENEELKPKGKIHRFVNSPNKVGCIFLMAVIFLLPHAELGRNDHREDAPHFAFQIFLVAL